MTQTATSYENYRSDFRELQTLLKDADPSWLRELRRDSMDRFLEMGFPTARKGNEPWKYTNVAPIARGEFRMPMNGATAAKPDLNAIKDVAPWHDDWTTLVFVDGALSKEMSSDLGSQAGMTIAPLSEALASDGTLLESQMSRYADYKADAFIALNTAFVRDGAYIVIDDGASVDRPIHLLFVSTGAGGLTVSYPRVLLVAQPNSSATLIESYVGLSDDEYFTDSVTEIVLEEGAHLEHYRLLMEGVSSYHVGMARVMQRDDSTYEGRVFERQVGLGRFDMYNELAGQRSVCSHNGLYFTDGTQHMDNFININHTAPYCTSRLNYKGILDGKSRAVFGGTVYVQPGAIKTDSMQTDKNLVLSPYAEMDSKPALFIYADDVKCGHGATAGNIDKDTVFYMRSRGLDLETASRFLIYGFAAEIIDTVRNDHLRVYLEELFLSALPSYSFEF